jgi:hypothetical protein
MCVKPLAKTPNQRLQGRNLEGVIVRNQIEFEDDEAVPQQAEIAKIMIGTCAVEIENIQEMRLRRGVDDAGLRQEIRGLQIGDCVNLTRVNGTESFGGDTLLVRVTRIKGHRFQGQLAKKPSSNRLSKLRLGAAVSFTAAHIHSLVKAQPPQRP